LLGRQARDSIEPEEIHASRNFYGSLLVQEYRSDTPSQSRTLINGRITHGSQLMNMPSFPTTYYGEKSGFGRAIKYFHDGNGTVRLGMVGLGTGTAAAHGRAGDVIRFYEINPEVNRIAGTHGDLFTFVKEARERNVKVDVAMGDARLVMDREARRGERQRFDVLALDAFSSDAIPLHLLTREALEVYLKHLARDADGNLTGVLAIHTSNRYLNLNPVVIRLAEQFKMQAVVVDRWEEDDGWVDNTDWVLVTANPRFLAHLVGLQEEAVEGEITFSELSKNAPLWTDDYTSLTRIIEWSDKIKKYVAYYENAKEKSYPLMAGLLLACVLAVVATRCWLAARISSSNPFESEDD